MRARSPDKRGQQKLAIPTYRVEAERNPETTPQYFQPKYVHCLRPAVDVVASSIDSHNSPSWAALIPILTNIINVKISVNVLEARKLTWLNPHSANSYVIVELNKKKHRTSIRRNMIEPCYREYFMFELYRSIRDIQRSSLWLAVMEPRCCAPPRLIGESTIDLGSIWSQPPTASGQLHDHQVFHKWAQLSLSRNPATGAVGFLKVDISILFRGDVQVMPVVVNEDKIEDNLLLPTGSEQQPANYMITVYGAIALPSGAHGQGDNRRVNKLPSSFVRVSFCGLSAKTAVQNRTSNPTYCEQINIVEMFPNMSELIKLEVCCAEGCFNRVIATALLQLGQISHDGENGFLPTFGPSLIHMYGNASGIVNSVSEDGPYHLGAMIVSLRTVVPYYQHELRSTSVEPVVPLSTENLWCMEDFCIFCPILEASMLDRRVCGKMCGVAMTVGEVPSDEQGDEDFIALMTEIKSRKLYYTGSLDVIKSTPPSHGYLDFESNFPVLQLAARLPDFRFRVYRNNMVYQIVTALEQSLADVESRLKNSRYNTPRELLEDLNRAADDTAAAILKYLELVQSTTAGGSDECNTRYSTELDQKQLALQKEETEKIYHQIKKRVKDCSTVSLICPTNKDIDVLHSSKKEVKLMLVEMKTVAENLKNLIFKTCEGWPDVVIWVLNGGSRVAYHKVPIADIMYSVISEQNGKKCGRIQTIYLKPLKCTKHLNNSVSCHCIAGKVELILWMGLYRQIHAFESSLPSGYKIRVKDYEMCLKTTSIVLECRAFVYRAKLINNMNRRNQSHMFVRINVMNSSKESKSKPESVTPTWNQVLKIRRAYCAPQSRIISEPPKVLVEIINCDLTNKHEIIGRCEVKPTVDDRTDNKYVPKLEWYDLNRGTEYTGQVLMSAQLLQVPEMLLKNTVYCGDDLQTVAGLKDLDSDDVEALPPNLIPQSVTYKVDVYWWGLREATTSRKPCVVFEIDELLIKSDVVADKKSNCNFPNGKSSHTFESPLSEAYSPPISIRLYDSSTFGRTLFLGTNIVKNPNKFIVQWISKAERNTRLRNLSITAANFFQVNQVLFVKKVSTPSISDIESTISFKENKKSKSKQSSWKKIFGNWKENEEEYALLPVASKENHQIKLLQNCSEMNVHTDSGDWWSRYYASVKMFSEEQYNENMDASDTIVMYQSELETQPEFSKFKDWCSTLKLYNGKKTGIPEKDEQLHCGFLKVGIAIYRWPPPENVVAVSHSGVELNYGYFSEHPSNEPQKFLVRVYIVKGINLVPKAFTGKLDPYVAISCGNKQLGDRKNYVKNTLNPIFGKMYEFRCTLPDDYLLTISLYDFDTVPPDEFIGSTTVDLEDRIFTKHRARVGIASRYYSTGAQKWRDCCKPSYILEELCEKNHMSPPIFPDSATVIINGIEYRDPDNKDYKSTAERKENICLSIIKKWHTLPMCGHHLVPEHVETRTLYNSDKPGLEQGKLHMWVDIFPLDPEIYIPPPVDITPRKLADYELRVYIWDIQGVTFDENGEIVNGIYVRAWIDTIEHAQYTDVHYKHADVGNFNSRMIFHFQYHHAEKKLVRKEKRPFTEVEEHFPPIFVVQVLDYDSITPENFLGSCSFNLNAVPKGAKSASRCNLEQIDKSKKSINLFQAMKMKSWWPLVHTNRNTGATTTVGMINLELTLLPKEKANMMPVAIEREPAIVTSMKPVRMNIFRQTRTIDAKEDSIDEKRGLLDCCKMLKGSWQREHTLILIGVCVVCLLLVATYLHVPHILWKKVMA